MTPEALPRALAGLVESRFPRLRKTVRTNLALLGTAFLSVLASVRSGNGRLSLGCMARAMPTPGGFHSREKRLHRFLNNPRLDARAVSGGLAGLLVPSRAGWCPVLLDQTTGGTSETLLAAVPYAGRALPLGCYAFAYPLAEPALKSQNQLEHVFLLDIEESLPRGVRPIWIADRGYARALLLEQNEREGRAYLLRGRGGTGIEIAGRRMKLRALPAGPTPARFPDVAYQARRKVRVDVVTVRDPAFEESWYLLAPPALRGLLSPERVVDLYRERMRIEQSFRDFKTHLGLRGLRLHKDVAARTGRLLLAFLVVYALCVLLGESPLGQAARTTLETPRATPRHGTRRTLSALTLAMLMLAHPAWRAPSLRFLLRLLRSGRAKHPWLPVARPPFFNPP